MKAADKPSAVKTSFPHTANEQEVGMKNKLRRGVN